MIRFTIYTYLFKPINEPQEPDLFSPEVKVDESLEMKQELLGELFKAESKLRFSRSRNKVEQVPVPCSMSFLLAVIPANPIMLCVFRPDQKGKPVTV